MQDRRVRKPEGGPEGGHPQLGDLLERPGGVATPSRRLGQGDTPKAPLWHIFTPRSENPRGAPRHAISSTVPPLR